MASLTELSISARKFVRYSVYAVILIIIGRFTYNTTVYLYKKYFPPPPPPPTKTFGRLPKLPFPVKDYPSDMKFNLETAEGKMPEFVDQLPVYYMPPLTPDIQAEANAKDWASRLGFEKEGKPIVENIKNVWIFPKKDYPSYMTMNIVTKVFSVSYDLHADPSAIQAFPPSPEQATQQAKEFFSTIGKQEEVQNRVVTTQYMRVDSDKFVPALSQSDAQFVKVNLFRKNFGKDKDLRSVTPKMPEANLWVMYGGGQKNSLIAAEYHFFEIDENKSSTYPLKTADEAWKDLIEGKGYIANIKDGVKQTTVRKVSLGYYDAGQYTEYYQPVYVFEGDDDFIGYVHAVANDQYGGD